MRPAVPFWLSCPFRSLKALGVVVAALTVMFAAIDQACAQSVARPRIEARENASTPTNFSRQELIAWCVVPFDAAKRGPTERAAMLAELGLKHLAYDWREEHVDSWDDELAALNKHGIELTAFWCTSSMQPVEDNQRIFQFLKRNAVSPQLWIMLPAQELEKIDDEAERISAAVKLVRDFATHADQFGSKVGLYNHGGWVGRPETLVKIMEALEDVDNVGVVYNFHHAHEDLEAFPAALGRLIPHLICLNLNGTTPDGPKIQSLGQGTMDSQILQWILESGYKGPIGVLDHRNEMDAKLSLEQNLTGLEGLLKAAQQDR